jgi:hypothetical protein
MPAACKLISGASFEADTLTMLREVFDEVWASVAPDFGADPEQVEDARIRLATIILKLARDRQLGPVEIAHTASRLIREAGAKGKVSP